MTVNGLRKSVTGAVGREQTANQTDPTWNLNSARILGMWVFPSWIPLLGVFHLQNKEYSYTGGLDGSDIVIWKSD